MVYKAAIIKPNTNFSSMETQYKQTEFKQAA